MRLPRLASALIIALSIVVLPSCGGGGGDSTSPPPPPPPAATLQVNPATLPAMTRGNPIMIDLSVNANSGTGTAPLTWQATGLPAGLSLQVLSPGLEAHIIGTPTSAGTSNVSISVTDAANISATRTYTATVDSRFVITTSELPPAVVGRFYDSTLTAANGNGALNWSGSLPSGLTLTPSSGHISGMPTVPGVFFLNFTVTDSSSPAQQASGFVDAAVGGQLQFSGSSNIAARRSEPLSTGINVSGGVFPLTFSLIGGTLPKGIALSIDGDLEGVARETGSFNPQIRVTDSANPPQEISRSFNVQVREKTLTIAEKSLTKAIVGRAYSYRFATDGGMVPILWNSPNPTVVPGLTFLNGVLTGTPTTAGEYTLNVSAQDSAASFDFASGSYSVTVIPAALGRNDSIATAKAISNGTFAGSISPYSTASGSDMPDTDYYRLTAVDGAEVSINVAESDPFSLIITDPVVEVLRADGSRFTSCREDSDSADLTPTAFDDPCLNDDQTSGIPSSFVVFKNTTGALVTFFIHVLDWSGDARPELRYTLTVSGAN